MVICLESVAHRTIYRPTSIGKWRPWVVLPYSMLHKLGRNPWAQFKATNIDQWECPVGQIGPSLGPKSFILRPVPIFPSLRGRVLAAKNWAHAKNLGGHRLAIQFTNLGPICALAFQPLDSINQNRICQN